MLRVAVGIKVGVSVCVGVLVSVAVNVGGSGVNVKDGVAAVKVGHKDACGAFCVSPAITVCAADVLMAFTSGRARPGTTHAMLAIHKTAKGIRFDDLMLSPDFSYNVKTGFIVPRSNILWQGISSAN